MLKFLSKILGGNKSEKNVAEISPLVKEINEWYQTFQTISIDELRSKTNEFKNEIQLALKDMNEQVHAISEQAEKIEEQHIHEKDALYRRLDEIKKEKDTALEKVLLKILPQAYAVMKETARRFKENTTLTATATELDKQIATTKKSYISIVNNQSVWKNTWMAAGGKVEWNMIHFDVQLIGGIVLHQGKIAEMTTGEGKTLVSTLPAYLNALAGEGVHIVTVNDYLSRRDSEWKSPIFEFLGLTVDCIDKYQPHSPERRNAYLADITYGTNNEFGFDYLRDNMVHYKNEIVQRKHHFAIIDEVDSVLIDDARTPLIISGPIGIQDNFQQFIQLNPRVEKLVDMQKRTCTQFLSEAKKKIAEGNDDPKDGGLALYRAHRGYPKNNALIKFLSEPGMRLTLQKTENYYLADQEKEMHVVDEALYFYIDEKNNSVELTDKGIHTLTPVDEDSNFFVLPDISISLAEIESNPSLSPDKKLEEKEKTINEYSAKTDRLHTIRQLLKAYTLFEKDIEYIVVEGQVKIVDEQTGRVLDGRRYSDGLHQAIEAKENVKIEATTQTYATITLQNYFRMYHKLAGMTGTAETEAGELWDIYKLDVVCVPTHLSMIRKDQEDFVFKTKREKYKAVIDEIENLRSQHRPVLVGTTSVEVSELLSRMLKQKQIPHNVLNAKQHAKEAQIITEAGLQGNVTIATNMAGRGTDIKLGTGVKEANGLAIIGTERHESRRVDRQLRGRAGRQGDPGSSQFFVSLEDDLMRMFGSERIAKIMNFAGYKEGEVIQHKMITKSIERAQKKVEENNFGIRKRLLEYDDVMSKQRQVIYAKRNHALFGERLSLDIDNSFYSVAQDIVLSFKNTNDFENMKLSMLIHLGINTTIDKETFQSNDEQKLVDIVYGESIKHYQEKKNAIIKQSLPVFIKIRKEQPAQIENVIVPFSDGKKEIPVLVPLDKTIASQGNQLLIEFEKTITLAFIDDTWKEHLRGMDDLRQSVQTAQYEQKDPLVIYKVEAFSLFKTMDTELNKNIIQFLCHAIIPEQRPLKEGKETKTDMSKLQEYKNDWNDQPTENGTTQPVEQEVKQMPILAEPKTGRNEPCTCGSGKKYKNCHGKGE